ncbi:MAG: hypothetical protein A2X49_12145 [Lentisphaerae bacterium GWF2_52_8]|nr:MAG: hypothetical protein A2X49_12145 [Lentisphaerae bacterium GWF2_52_8]
MLVYLCPALMDWLIFFVLTAVMYVAGERGVGFGGCSILGIIFQVAYMGCSIAAGHMLTRKNAKRILFLSTLFCGLTAACCLWLESMIPLSAALAFFGVFSAFFFNAFQSFMRGESAPGTLKKTVALYSLSWSSGAAAGCMTAGLMCKLGIFWMFASIFACMLVIAGFLLVHKSRGHDELSSDEHVEEGSAGARQVSSAYVLVGWMMIFVIVFVQRPVFTFLPRDFGSRGVDSLLASLPLFGHMAGQALFSWLMWRFRDHLYRKTPFLLIQGLAAAGFLVIWKFPSYPVCLAGLSLLGIYAGFAYFCAVYYSSNSGRRAFNVGVNESLVGLGSIAGILAGYFWMRTNAEISDLYLMCGLGLLVSAVFQFVAALPAKQGKCPEPETMTPL